MNIIKLNLEINVKKSTVTKPIRFTKIYQTINKNEVEQK